MRIKGNVFVCMEITPKKLVMRTDLQLNFSHWNTTNTQNWKSAFEQNSFIPGWSCTTCVCVMKKKFFQIWVEIVRAHDKNKVIMYRKSHIRQGKSSILVIFTGVSPHVVADFHERVALAFWNVVTWESKACRSDFKVIYHLFLDFRYVSGHWHFGSRPT